MATEILKFKPHKEFDLIKFNEIDVSRFKKFEECPSCGFKNKHSVAVELGGSSWNTVVSIAVCKECDHTYYLNPPEKHFIEEWYKKQWMKTKTESCLEAHKPVQAINKAASIIIDLNILDHELQIIDIGCSHGGTLKSLANSGFKNVYGCELSELRAKVASREFPNKIFSCNYREILHESSWDVIYCNHVFEHMYNPSDFIQWSKSVLSEKGILIINVPDAKSETSVRQSLFLPHLHSFSKKSIMRIAKRHDFEIIFWEGARQDELCCVFYKKSNTMINPSQKKFHKFDNNNNIHFSEYYNRLQSPWKNTPVNKSVSITDPVSGMTTCKNTAWQSYYELKYFRKLYFKFFQHLCLFFKKTGFKKLSILMGLPLRFISTDEYKFQSFGYIKFKNTQSGIAKASIPRVGKDNQACFIIK